MKHNGSRTGSRRLYLRRLVARSCVKKETRRKQDIQDNRGNNRFSSLERASEIEAAFIRKRARSPESRFNLMKILMKANIFAEDAWQ